MKKLLVIQISAFILIAGALGGMFLYTDAYEDVQSRIVLVLCLSCIKLDPKTQLDFTFETATNQPHSNFVLDNLTKGPVFLAFREDVCAACDIMEPVIQDIFDVEFEKEEIVIKTVSFQGTNVTFIHININHASKEMGDSLFIYDKDHIGGVPMFTIVTLGYHHGFVEPYYTTAYGILNLEEYDARKELLMNIIQDGIDLYNENKVGYDIN